jgi:uncharacterized protein YgiM (DUF1202 family)
MKKNQFQIIAAIIGIAGIYLVYNYIKGQQEKKGEKGKKESETTPTPTPTPTPNPNPFNSKLNVITSGGNYVVKTISSTGKLNVRTLPNTGSASKVLYQLNNGDVVKAQKSVAVDGWYEILDPSKSFPVVVGYVSASYLVPKA